jgi:hypothetical protein
MWDHGVSITSQAVLHVWDFRMVHMEYIWNIYGIYMEYGIWNIIVRSFLRRNIFPIFPYWFPKYPPTFWTQTHSGVSWSIYCPLTILHPSFNGCEGGNIYGPGNPGFHNQSWLVASTPLKNMCSSVGMMTPNIWKVVLSIPWFQSPPTRKIWGSSQVNPLNHGPRDPYPLFPIVATDVMDSMDSGEGSTWSWHAGVVPKPVHLNKAGVFCMLCKYLYKVYIYIII